MSKPKKWWHRVHRCDVCSRRTRAPFWRLPVGWAKSAYSVSAFVEQITVACRRCVAATT